MKNILRILIYEMVDGAGTMSESPPTNIESLNSVGKAPLGKPSAT